MIATFTGTRQGWTGAQFKGVRRVFHILKDQGCRTLLHGVCVGSDESADALAIDEFQFITVGYPGVNGQGQSPWRSHGCRCAMMPEEEYQIRDHKMVDRSEAVVATPKGMFEETRGSGTWLTIRYAKKQGKRLYIVYPTGEIHVYQGYEQIAKF